MGDLEILANGFKNRRILITGDTGFKGSWLALWLKGLGADVVGYALPPEGVPNHFNLLGLDRMIHHVDGDIRDLPKLSQIFNDHQPEIVFHLAAQALVRQSYHDPKLTFDTNVGGSVNVLELARQSASLRALIYVTSDKCYLNKEWIWSYRENDELGGRDPYSASKAAAELVFSAYRHSFFDGRANVGVASVRAGNVIGGGDWSVDRIVPDALRALEEGRALRLRNPDAIRPWQYVLEPIYGYLMLAQAIIRDPLRYSGSWNFGPREESVHTVRDLAEAIIACWGSGSLEEERKNDQLHEATLLALNCEKASRSLGWRPRWVFDRCIKETVFWYRDVKSGKSALEVSQKQIARYEETESD